MCVYVCVGGCWSGKRRNSASRVRYFWSRDVAEEIERTWTMKSLIYHDKAFWLYSASNGKKF